MTDAMSVTADELRRARRSVRNFTRAESADSRAIRTNPVQPHPAPARGLA